MLLAPIDSTGAPDPAGAWKNPVRDPDTSIQDDSQRGLYIWVAPVLANAAVTNANSRPANPSILTAAIGYQGQTSFNANGNFDTNFTTCLPYPAVSGATVKDIANGARFTEGSLVQLDDFDPGVTVDDYLTPAPVCGVATPTEQAYFQLFLTPDKHQLIAA